MFKVPGEANWVKLINQLSWVTQLHVCCVPYLGTCIPVYQAASTTPCYTQHTQEDYNKVEKTEATIYKTDTVKGTDKTWLPYSKSNLKTNIIQWIRLPLPALLSECFSFLFGPSSACHFTYLTYCLYIIKFMKFSSCSLHFFRGEGGSGVYCNTL